MTGLLMLVGIAFVLVIATKADESPQRAPAPGARWRGLPFVPSPHHSPRNATVSAIILHYTAGGPGAGAVKWFQDRESMVSAHFVVDRDGAITQCVELERAAWHAGDAELPDGSVNVNAKTIGIEIANWGKSSADKPGYVKATLRLKDGAAVEGWWEPYPEPQVAAVAWLVREIQKDFPAASTILGHEAVSKRVGRKTDPGPLWPWSRVRGRLDA